MAWDYQMPSWRNLSCPAWLRASVFSLSRGHVRGWYKLWMTSSGQGKLTASKGIKPPPCWPVSPISGTAEFLTCSHNGLWVHSGAISLILAVLILYNPLRLWRHLRRPHTPVRAEIYSVHHLKASVPQTCHTTVSLTCRSSEWDAGQGAPGVVSFSLSFLNPP